MEIKIVDEVDDGDFTVGEQYQVSSRYPSFVYAIDNKGELQPVYNYQFKVVG